MIQEKELLIFLVLLLAAIATLAGWFARIAWEQYKADQEREEQAEKHRQEYEQARCKEYEEQIKQHNRKDLILTWAEAAKRGAKK